MCLTEYECLSIFSPTNFGVYILSVSCNIKCNWNEPICIVHRAHRDWTTATVTKTNSHWSLRRSLKCLRWEDRLSEELHISYNQNFPLKSQKIVQSVWQIPEVQSRNDVCDTNTVKHQVSCLLVENVCMCFNWIWVFNNYLILLGQISICVSGTM